MKTLPLSEVLASATPLPYRVQLEETPVLVGGDDAVCRIYKASDNPLAVANAALLAHSANMLPELAEALEVAQAQIAMLIHRARTKPPTADMLQFAEEDLAEIRATLSRARSVPMP